MVYNFKNEYFLLNFVFLFVENKFDYSWKTTAATKRRRWEATLLIAQRHPAEEASVAQASMQNNDRQEESSVKRIRQQPNEKLPTPSRIFHHYY